MRDKIAQPQNCRVVIFKFWPYDFESWPKQLNLVCDIPSIVWLLFVRSLIIIHQYMWKTWKGKNVETDGQMDNRAVSIYPLSNYVCGGINIYIYLQSDSKIFIIWYISFISFSLIKPCTSLNLIGISIPIHRFS